MTQDELNLVLDALKFCHGGEPCGTAEAIAVVEKALAQRTWVGLTDKVITQVINSMPKKMRGFMVDWDLYELARAIEAKLKQKNGFTEEKNKK